MDPEIARLQKENADLKEIIQHLKGGIDYLENSKVPWLEGEINRLRQEIWGRK